MTDDTVPTPPPGFTMDSAVPPPPTGFKLDAGGVSASAPPKRPSMIDEAVDSLKVAGNALHAGFDAANLNGFGGLVARKGFELSGYGMDKLRSAYPNESEDQLKARQKAIINQTVQAARKEAGDRLAANPMVLQNPITGKKSGINPVGFVGSIAGAADPTYLVNPAEGVAKSLALNGVKGAAAHIGANVAAHALLGASTDAAYQGADILDGIQKDFDVKRNLSAAGAAGAFGGLVAGAHEAPEFIQGLFKDRNVDTTPVADPRSSGPRTPITGAKPPPEWVQQHNKVLQTGSEQDIMNLFKDTNIPAPSFEDTHAFVKNRDANVASGAEPVDHTPDLYTPPPVDNVQAVQEHVAHQTKDWKNAPDFEIIGDHNDIADPAIKAQAIEGGADNPNALGFYGQDGKVRIFANRLTSEADANAVLYHESLGHHGLAEQFGSRLDSTIDTLLKRNVGQFGRDVTAWQKENPGAYGGSKTRAAEEVLAQQSEAGRIKPSVADAITAQVRSFGRKMGMKLSYSDAEVRQILAMAHSAVIDGKGRNVRANGFATKPRFKFDGQAPDNDNISFHDLPHETQQSWKQTALRDSARDLSAWRERINDPESSPRRVAQAKRLLAVAEERHRNLMKASTPGEIWSRMPDYIKNTINQKESVRGSDPRFMFAGPMAETHNPQEHANMTDMISKGATAEEARTATGYHVADDGHVRHELSDDEAMLKSPMAGEGEGRLEQFLHHPRLYEAYPSLRKARVEVRDELPNGAEGTAELTHDGPKITIRSGLDPETARNTLLHEAQHAVQMKEHYPGVHDTDTMNMSDHEYANNPLEKEAYATGDRADMSAMERRQTEPPKFMMREPIDFGEPAAKEHPEYQSQLREFLHNWANFKSNHQDDITKFQQAARKADDHYRATQDPSHSVQDTYQDEWRKLNSLIDKEIPGLNPHVKTDIMEDIHDPYKMELREDKWNDSLDQFSSKFMMRKGVDPKDVGDETWEWLSLGYKPQPARGWDEARKMADEAGVPPENIKDVRGAGNLDRMAFIYGRAREQNEAALSALGKKVEAQGHMTDEDIGEQIRLLAQNDYILGRISNHASQLGRGLNSMKAVGYTKNQLLKLREALQEAGSNLTELTDPDFATKFLKQYNALLQNGNPKGAQAMLNMASKPYWWQHVLSYRQNMMLSGLSTHLKSTMDMATTMGNDMIESAVASAVGGPVRAVLRTADPGVHPTEVGMRIWGLVRATLEGDTWKNAAKAFNDTHSNRFLNSGTLPNPESPGPLSWPTRAISVQDQFFRSILQNSELYALGARRALRDLKASGKSFTNDDVLTLGASYARAPSEQMMLQAKQAMDAAYTAGRAPTPQEWDAMEEAKKAIAMTKNAKGLAEQTMLMNKSPINDAIDAAKRIRPGMGKGEQAFKFAVNWLTPFIKVSSNALMNQIIRRSPLSFLDPVTRADWVAGGARRDIAISRSVIGGAKLAFYWWAAGEAKDKLTGEGSGNPSKTAEMKAGGWSPNAVHENGRYNRNSNLNLSLNPADLHNNLATMVAGVREAYEQGASKDDTVLGLKLAMQSIMNGMASQSFIGDLTPGFNLFDGKGQAGITMKDRFVQDQAKTLVPNLMTQTAKIADPNLHDTRDSGVLGAMATGVPGLTNTQPVSYNVYGQPMKTGTSPTGIHTWVTNGNGTNEPTDPTEKELARLAKLTPAAVVTPVQRSLSLGKDFGLPAGTKVKLTSAQFEEYQKQAGQAIVAGVKAQMDSGDWGQMSDKDKIVAVKKIQTDAKKQAREDLVAQDGWLNSKQLTSLKEAAGDGS